MSENTDKKTKPSIFTVSSDRDKTTIDIPLSESRREAERIQRVRRAKRRRRRASLSNYIAMLNVTTMMGLICFGFVYVTFFKHETIAEDENRYLAKFPKFSVSSYLNGEYTEGVANYFDDTVHNRAKIKTFIADKIMPLKGMKYGGDDGVELFGGTFEHVSSKTTAPVTAAVTTVSSASSDGTAATSAQETVVTTTTTEPLPNAAEPAAENGEVTNNILIVNGRGISLYGGGWGNELEYASYLNQYKEALGDSVNVYSMVLPTSSAFYLPENYQSLSYNEKDDFDRIAAALVNVTPVDAYTALLKHKNEPIYSRTDHHWQSLGAYYAAQEFAKDAGVPFAELNDTNYETVTLPGYVGTLYSYTQSATLLNNPEDFVFYKPKTNVTVTQYSTSFTDPIDVPLFNDPEHLATANYYMVFGGDDRIAHVQTECKNGRTLVIFKDSYGNALVPLLTSSFENIYLCDIRYFDLNAVSFIKDVGATDLLFAMCSYSAVGGNRNCIYQNLTR